MLTVLLSALAVMGLVNGTALLLVAYRYFSGDHPRQPRCAVRPRIEDEPGWIAYAAQIARRLPVAPAAVPAQTPER